MIRDILASLGQIAPVISADVPVITFQQIAPDAHSSHAEIRHSTGISIVTINFVVLMDTAHACVARVVGTDVAVITFEEALADTLPILADVCNGAGVPIIAGLGIRSALAADDRVTGIVCAVVAVVAVDHGTALTDAIEAGFT